MSTSPSIPEPMIEIVEVPDTDPAPAPVATVELRGRTFPVGSHAVPLAAMMDLAVMAKKQQAGATISNAEGLDYLTELKEVLQFLIDEDAWPEFWAHAKRSGADGDDFQAVIAQAVEARSGGRPTRPPPASPAGRSTTAPNSAAGSSSPDSSPIRQGDLRVQQDLEARGRPDLALVVKRAREASTTTSTG